MTITASKPDLWIQLVRDSLAPELRAQPWATPGEMAVALDRTTIQTPALQLIDEHLVKVADGEIERLIISMPPQEGKSERASRRFPLWMLHRNPNLRIAIVSYGHDVARRWGGRIRDDLRDNPRLGLTLSASTAAKHEFELLGYQGGVFCTGIDGGLTSRPVDCVSGDVLIESDRGQITAEVAYEQGISRILAYDHASGRAVWRDVEASRRIPGRHVVEVVTEAGRVLTCTPDHRVYTSRGYLPAGSLRSGDTLVGLVAADRVSLRGDLRGAEDEDPQRGHARAGAVLHPGVHECGVLGREPDAVLRLRKAGSAEPRQDLFERVSSGSAAASGADLPGVLSGVPAPCHGRDVLQPDVRGRRSLAADDRPGQRPVQGWQELREVVPVDASTDPGARRVPVRGVRRSPGCGVHSSWPVGHEVGSRCASHRPRRTAQPGRELDHALRDMPRHAPQVEHDTVALVRNRGDETVDVYDFQVEGTHNFFGNGVLVHNCLIIDDPYKNAKDADSKAWALTVRDFWEEVALPRLAPGAPVVLIQTRWREDDLAGWLAEQGDDWTILNIPAQADHDPEKGETDVLGREPGEFMESARRRTTPDWLKKIREVGSRTWNALYQGRPSPAEGSIFKREHWQEYGQPQHVERGDGACIVVGYDDLLISWDMTFKGTTVSKNGKTADTDYVCGQVWMRRGADAFLLDQVHGRMDFPETCRQVRALAAKWPQAVLKLVEDKANGSAVIAQLSRTVPGIVPVEPDGGKEARAAAVSPLQEGGNVWLPAPELAPWVGALIDEAAGFPTAAHDDQVDALTQALNRLVLQPLLAGDLDVVTMADLDDELADFGQYVP